MEFWTGLFLAKIHYKRRKVNPPALPHTKSFVQSTASCSWHLSYTATKNRQRKQVVIYFSSRFSLCIKPPHPSVAALFLFVNKYFVGAPGTTVSGGKTDYRIPSRAFCSKDAILFLLHRFTAELKHRMA